MTDDNKKYDPSRTAWISAKRVGATNEQADEQADRVGLERKEERNRLDQESDKTWVKENKKAIIGALVSGVIIIIIAVADFIAEVIST